MSATYVIYQIRNNVNGKCYVGQSYRYKQRKQDHIRGLDGNKHGNVHLQSSWNKHGAESFEFSILSKGHTKAEADAEEIRLIAEGRLLHRNFGYNLAPGGGGIMAGFKYPPEYTGRWKGAVNITPEGLVKIDESRRNRVWSTESRARAAAAQKTRYASVPHSEDTKEKMRAKKHGRKLSPEHRAKMVIAQKTRRADEKLSGVKLVSEETRAKQSAAQNARYIREGRSKLNSKP
jgi:group I intron endonuclease